MRIIIIFYIKKKKSEKMAKIKENKFYKFYEIFGNRKMKLSRDLIVSVNNQHVTLRSKSREICK